MIRLWPQRTAPAPVEAVAPAPVVQAAPMVMEPAQRGMSIRNIARAGRAFARGYDAAKMDRHTEGWNGDWGISTWDIRHQLRMVRNRSREAWKNDPYLTRWGAIIRNNVIGADGIQLVMDVCDWGYDKRGEWVKKPDAMANGIIQRDWARWAKNPEYVDAAGIEDLAMIEWAAVIDWHREGEALLRLLPGFGYPENPFAFSVARIRPDSLALEYSCEMPDGTNVYNGVHVNKWGRPLGYWFYTMQLPTGIWSGERIYIPASEIVHLYAQDYAGQTRGFPLVACVLRSLKILYGYDEAEVIKARIQAMENDVWEVKDPAMAMDGSEIADPQSEDDRSQFEQINEPGESAIAPRGWTKNRHPSTAPNSVYPSFHMEMVRRIAGGLETAYHSFANDPSNVNMNAGRLASLEDRESWKVKQHVIATMMMSKIFSAPRGWLTMYLSTGMSPLPLSKRARFNAPTWQGRRWPAYDLNGEVAYNEWAVKHGITTDSALTAEAGGNRATNVATVRQEMVEEEGTPLADRFMSESSLSAKAASQPDDGTKAEDQQKPGKGPTP